jgi:hypothetical protein
MPQPPDLENGHGTVIPFEDRTGRITKARSWWRDAKNIRWLIGAAVFLMALGAVAVEHLQGTRLDRLESTVKDTTERSIRIDGELPVIERELDLIARMVGVPPTMIPAHPAASSAAP